MVGKILSLHSVSLTMLLSFSCDLHLVLSAFETRALLIRMTRFLSVHSRRFSVKFSVSLSVKEFKRFKKASETVFETFWIFLVMICISVMGDSIERLVIDVKHDSCASISQKTLLTDKIKKTLVRKDN